MERHTGLPAFLLHWGLGVVAAVTMLLVAAPGGASVSLQRPSPAQLHSRIAACDVDANAVAGASHANELIMVIAPSSHAQTASVELFRRSGGCFRSIAGPYGAFVGVHGLSAHHREGDGTTPLGLFGLRPMIYGAAANPGLASPYHRLVCGDWWDEDPRTNNYNRFVHVACGATPPFAGNSEALWQKVPQYNYFAVVSYNMNPTVKGRGSAIFLHVQKGSPTTGCVSLAQNHLITVLSDLRASLHPLIDITTRTLLQR